MDNETLNSSIKPMMREMVDRLNKWTEFYDAGNPVVSDSEWDSVYYNLVNLEKSFNFAFPDSPSQSIHYKQVDKLNKVEHNHPMLSLDKTKDWEQFVQYFGDKDVVGMLKLDGLTCSLHYSYGTLISAETRGNGIVGEDILHNAWVIKNIPKYIEYKDDLIIDGEVISTKQNFEKFSDKYANQRNFASGSIRLLNSKECEERNLSFVVWNVIKGFDEENSFLKKLMAVEKLGFDIVPWTSSFDWDATDFLTEQAETLGYPIDGIVGRFDDIKYGNSLGETSHHSRAAYAYKFFDEEYETTLLDIEWTMGRTGILTPVAVFEPIDDGDSIIERASLHNVSIMKEQLYIPYVGEHIWIYKANQIIPQISNHRWVANDYDPMINIIKMPEVCPICGEPTEIKTSNGVETLWCSNPNCEGKLINRIEHFFGKKGIDAKGISKATIEKLIDWGWVSSIYDMLNLQTHYQEWMKKPGFGEKSVNKILDGIDNAIDNITLSKFIAAIGIPEIGTTAAKQLAKEFTYYTEFRDAIKVKWDFSTLPDIGEVTYSSIINFNYDEADKIAEVIDKDIAEPFEENDNALDGLTFVITGKLFKYGTRENLKKIIIANGGKVTDSVTSKTNYLINNDINSTSSKNKKAKELGVIIITENEFGDML